ncbi:MAG TPA: hypothetical protein VIX73_23175 [Kofleriaceae bacterium]|jgi:hypothetical protein
MSASVTASGGTTPPGAGVPNPIGTTSADGAHVALGATTDAESAAGNGTVIALLKRHRTLLASIVLLLGAGLPAALVAGRLDVSLGAFNASLPTGTNHIGRVAADTVLGGQLDSIAYKRRAALDTVRVLAAGRLDSTGLTRRAALDTLRYGIVADTARDRASVTTGGATGVVQLGSTLGKTNVYLTGSLTTTAVTADQVILTRTVTAGKTFYVSYACLQARLTAVSATASILGAASIETPSGTKVITFTFTNPTTSETNPVCVPIVEPISVAAAAVIRCVTTPAATTSMLWVCNFGGYEK